MLPIDVIGLKNFRIFDDKQGFLEKLSAINLLTGTNNSGKSSIIKGLQLLKNSVQSGVFPYGLDLTEQEHLLGNFENVFFNASSKEISVSLPFNFLGLKHYHIDLTYEVFPPDAYQAKLRKMEVRDSLDNGTLFSFAYREANDLHKEQDLERYKKDLAEYKELQRDPQYKKKDFLSKYGIFGRPDDDILKGFVDWSVDCKKLKGYLVDALDFYLLYKDNKDSGHWLSAADRIAEEEVMYYIPSVFVNSFKPKADIEIWKEFLENGLKTDKLEGALKIRERDFEPPELFYPSLEVEDVFYASCKEIIRDNLKWRDIDKDNKNKYNVLEQAFIKAMALLEQRLLSINYLSTIREQNARIYNASLNTPFINLLKEFLSLQHDRTNFLNKYLRAFDIGKSIEIELRQDYQLIFVSVIDLEGKKRELVDFGYGIKQLILLLIQICVLAERNKRRVHQYDHNGEYWTNHFDFSMLLIEEPETNLHPKWQSLLAEMFFEANNQFNIQLVIETHSEYLIRKFQNLVANGMEHDRIRIFYLRNLKTKSDDKKQVEVIEIEKDGAIPYELFDAGFFDESSTLKLSLLNIRRDNFLAEFEAMKSDLEENDEKITKLEQKVDEFNLKTDISHYLLELEILFDTSKLEHITIKYLASGLFLLNNIGVGSDYSPVLLQYGRALESELKKVFLDVDSTKKWMIGVMQGSLEKFKFGSSSLSISCSATEFRTLRTTLTNLFNRPQDLRIELINGLREQRNSVAHSGLVKSKIEAEQYILSVNEFLSEWILQLK